MPDEDMAHFPDRYGENYLYLLEVDLNHVHAFWEIAPNSIPENILDKSREKADLCLKVFCDFLDDASQSSSVSCDIPVEDLIDDWFVELKDQPITCHVELGYYKAEKAIFIPICRSNILESPLKSNPMVKEGEREIPLSPAQEEDQGEMAGQKQEKASSIKEVIKRQDVEAYYRSLSDRLVSPAKVSPWRFLLDSLYSDIFSIKEDEASTRFSEPMDFSFEDPSPDDTFFSNNSSSNS